MSTEVLFKPAKQKREKLTIVKVKPQYVMSMNDHLNLSSDADDSKPSKHFAYLKQTLGTILPQCLHEVCQKRPRDPIEFIALFLYKSVDCELYFYEKAIFSKELQLMSLELKKENAVRQSNIEKIKKKIQELKILLRGDKKIEAMLWMEARKKSMLMAEEEEEDHKEADTDFEEEEKPETALALQETELVKDQKVQDIKPSKLAYVSKVTPMLIKNPPKVRKKTSKHRISKKKESYKSTDSEDNSHSTLKTESSKFSDRSSTASSKIHSEFSDATASRIDSEHDTMTESGSIVRSDVKEDESVVSEPVVESKAKTSSPRFPLNSHHHPYESDTVPDSDAQNGNKLMGTKDRINSSPNIKNTKKLGDLKSWESRLPEASPGKKMKKKNMVSPRVKASSPSYDYSADESLQQKKGKGTEEISSPASQKLDSKTSSDKQSTDEDDGVGKATEMIIDRGKKEGQKDEYSGADSRGKDKLKKKLRTSAVKVKHMPDDKKSKKPDMEKVQEEKTDKRLEKDKDESGQKKKLKKKKDVHDEVADCTDVDELPWSKKSSSRHVSDRAHRQVDYRSKNELAELEEEKFNTKMDEEIETNRFRERKSSKLEAVVDQVTKLPKTKREDFGDIDKDRFDGSPIRPVQQFKQIMSPSARTPEISKAKTLDYSPERSPDVQGKGKKKMSSVSSFMSSDVNEKKKEKNGEEMMKSPEIEVKPTKMDRSPVKSKEADKAREQYLGKGKAVGRISPSQERIDTSSKKTKDKAADRENVNIIHDKDSTVVLKEKESFRDKKVKEEVKAVDDKKAISKKTTSDAKRKKEESGKVGPSIEADDVILRKMKADKGKGAESALSDTEADEREISKKPTPDKRKLKKSKKYDEEFTTDTADEISSTKSKVDKKKDRALEDSSDYEATAKKITKSKEMEKESGAEMKHKSQKGEFGKIAEESEISDDDAMKKKIGKKRTTDKTSKEEVSDSEEVQMTKDKNAYPKDDEDLKEKKRGKGQLVDEGEEDTERKKDKDRVANDGVVKEKNREKERFADDKEGKEKRKGKDDDDKEKRRAHERVTDVDKDKEKRRKDSFPDDEEDKEKRRGKERFVDEDDKERKRRKERVTDEENKRRSKERFADDEEDKEKRRGKEREEDDNEKRRGQERITDEEALVKTIKARRESYSLTDEESDKKKRFEDDESDFKMEKSRKEKEHIESILYEKKLDEDKDEVISKHKTHSKDDREENKPEEFDSGRRSITEGEETEFKRKNVSSKVRRDEDDQLSDKDGAKPLKNKKSPEKDVSEEDRAMLNDLDEDANFKKKRDKHMEEHDSDRVDKDDEGYSRKKRERHKGERDEVDDQEAVKEKKEMKFKEEISDLDDKDEPISAKRDASYLEKSKKNKNRHEIFSLDKYADDVSEDNDDLKKYSPDVHRETSKHKRRAKKGLADDRSSSDMTSTDISVSEVPRRLSTSEQRYKARKAADDQDDSQEVSEKRKEKRSRRSPGDSPQRVVSLPGLSDCLGSAEDLTSQPDTDETDDRRRMKKFSKKRFKDEQDDEDAGRYTQVDSDDEVKVARSKEEDEVRFDGFVKKKSSFLSHEDDYSRGALFSDGKKPKKKRLSTKMSTPVQCEWFLDKPRVLVCKHPVLGEIRSHQPVLYNILDTPNYWDHEEFNCQVFYEHEIYSMCDPRSDDKEYADRMMEWHEEDWAL